MNGNHQTGAVRFYKDTAHPPIFLAEREQKNTCLDLTMFPFADLLPIASLDPLGSQRARNPLMLQRAGWRSRRVNLEVEMESLPLENIFK